MLGDGRFNIRYQQLAANAVKGKQCLQIVLTMVTLTAIFFHC